MGAGPVVDASTVPSAVGGSLLRGGLASPRPRGRSAPTGPSLDVPIVPMRLLVDPAGIAHHQTAVAVATPQRRLARAAVCAHSGAAATAAPPIRRGAAGGRATTALGVPPTLPGCGLASILRSVHRRS